MSIIQLHHDNRLAYPAMKNLPSLPQHAIDLAKYHPIITFRGTGTVKPDCSYKKINACSRFLNLPQRDLIFYGIESDSPLAPLILWDAVHRLAIGATVMLLGDYGHISYLERAYFQTSLTVEKRDGERVYLRKIAPLKAELDAGLHRWSFCIPTGPGDATGLNMVVKRILELKVPEKEILLCGRPDKSFRYFDHVRIVGEDIPAPPVWITRKKNVLAQEARYENLCILHDRVFLPLDFMAVMQRFGDYYPFAGFQSLWFDDKLNLSPVRYSDYGCAEEDHHVNVVAINKQGQPSLFRPELFTEIEKQNFKIANPLRLQRGSYLTGSLYIVKRSVWLHTPQNDELYWAQFEDIEQARRCERHGIPHVIIKGAFTQSLFARPILYFAGYSSYFSANGTASMTRKVLPLAAEMLKPLIKLSENEAQIRLARFSSKYCHSGISRYANESDMLGRIISIVYSAQMPFQKSAIACFIDDIERDVLCDQLGFGSKQWLLEQFIQHRTLCKINLGPRFKELAFQFSQRPDGRRFYKNILDYFPKRGWAVKFGSWLSAIRLARVNGDYFYHPDGWYGYYRSIMACTPFIDYAKD